MLVTYGVAPEELADGVQGDLLPDPECCITEPLDTRFITLQHIQQHIFSRSCTVELRSGAYVEPT